MIFFNFCAKKQFNKGFTLIETVMGIFIAAILIITVFYLFDGLGRIRVFCEAQIASTEQERLAMAEIVEYSAQSHRVLASQTIGGVDYNSNASSLVLQLPAIDANGDIIDGAWDFAVFFLAGDDLQFMLQPDAASSRLPAQRRLSDSASILEFFYDNADFTQVRYVEVNLAVAKTARGQILIGRSRQKTELKNY